MGSGCYYQLVCLSLEENCHHFAVFEESYQNFKIDLLIICRYIIKIILILDCV